GEAKNSMNPNLVRLAGKNGRTRVVVTGMGTVNPLGKDLEEYWHGLIEGRSGASPIERFPSDRLVTKFACQVNTFDPQDYIERKAPQRRPRFSQMAVAAPGMRLAAPGLDPSREDSSRFGLARGPGTAGSDVRPRPRWLRAGRGIGDLDPRVTRACDQSRRAHLRRDPWLRDHQRRVPPGRAG